MWRRHAMRGGAVACDSTDARGSLVLLRLFKAVTNASSSASEHVYSHMPLGLQLLCLDVW